MKYEMAQADNPEEIVKAAQFAIIEAMRDVFKQMKRDIKNPGLTWDQIDDCLLMFKEKKPTVIIQSEPM